jgi:nucleotide-binding universal stress UspA family protein
VLGSVEVARPDLVPAATAGYRRILVPLTQSAIGDELLATAVKLAAENDASIHVLNVMKVGMESALDAPLEAREETAEVTLAEAQALAAEQGVCVAGRVVRARAIGEAIVEEAVLDGTDLIMLGSSPRWRRQSRFFSPTVDYVLRRAPCEVMVVAFPAQAFAEEGEEG